MLTVVATTLVEPKSKIELVDLLYLNVCVSDCYAYNMQFMGLFMASIVFEIRFMILA